MALVPIVHGIPVLDIVETVEELELEAKNAVVLQHYLDVLPNSILVSDLAEQCLRAWFPRLFGKSLRKKPFSDIEFTMTASNPYAAWRYVMNHTDGRDTHFKQTAALRRYHVELGTMWGLVNYAAKYDPDGIYIAQKEHFSLAAAYGLPKRLETGADCFPHHQWSEQSQGRDIEAEHARRKGGKSGMMGGISRVRWKAARASNEHSRV
jgi:hypothetical protein